MINIEERNRATASWKDMMEKDFDLYYTPGINSPSPEMRTATAMEYAAYQLGQINHKLDRMIAALGSTAEATPPILTGINADLRSCRWDYEPRLYGTRLCFDGFLGEIMRRATARPYLLTQTPYHIVE